MTYWPCEDAPELLEAKRLVLLSNRFGILPSQLIKMDVAVVECLERWLPPLGPGTDG